ncbi:hypothetical protein [Adlercreutzia caecimuris]|jgi:hypothetical protein|uniref:hypothetical protein n=2 Tax=Coriobacteriia TaxID=84998 RepID=UPI00272AF06B|nr:hypothetical protein [Adlercreutzia caecimuris]
MPSADVKELWATNEANLVAIASDVDLFADYLALMGTHTRKSPMNLASIQAHGDYADKTVLKTREEWDDLVGVQNADDGTYRSAVKDDAEAIPVVCSRGRNAFAIDYLYPLEALDRRPSQNTYLGRPAKIDLGRNDDAAVFAAAKAHLKGEKGIDLEKLPANALFAIEARYGLPHTVEPVLPTLEVKELKAELSELSKQVDKVAFLLDRSIRYNRSQHRAAHAPKVAAVNERFASAASALKEEAAVEEAEAAREPEPEAKEEPPAEAQEVEYDQTSISYDGYLALQEKAKAKDERFRHEFAESCVEERKRAREERGAHSPTDIATAATAAVAAIGAQAKRNPLDQHKIG